MEKTLTQYIDEMLKRYHKQYDWGEPRDIDPTDCLMSAEELEKAAFSEKFDMTEFVEMIQEDDYFRNLVQERLDQGNY